MIKKKSIFIYNTFKYKIPIPIKTDYEKECLKMNVKYCSIKRVLVRGKWKYYLLLTIDGKPPLKLKNGSLMHPIGKGDVGLDIGTQTLAIATPYKAELLELCDKVERHSKKKEALEIKMIRSLNSTNPGACTPTGTRIKGMKLPIKSNHYLKLQMEHKELLRHLTAVKKYQHTLMANYIISLGDNIYIEKMDFRKMVMQWHTKRKIKRGCEKTQFLKN